jgi:hypothetical protein
MKSKGFALVLRAAVTPIALLAFAFATGCGQREPTPTAVAAGGHVHQAPHGGTLVELGQHTFNLEFVLDRAAGKLTAYVLDGHASNFVRIAAPSFDIVAFVGGERRPLTLRAVANTVTGETVGNTSQFEAQADWLKKTAEFPGSLPSIEVGGYKFEGVALYLRQTK